MKTQEKVWMSYVDAVMFLGGMRQFEELSNEELDVLYFHIFQQRAYHMSREGFIHALTEKRKSFVHP